MSFLWVKFKNNQAVEVSTENCRNISSFTEACIKKLPRVLGSFDSAQLFLSTTVDGSSPLDPGDPIPATPNT